MLALEAESVPVVPGLAYATIAAGDFLGGGAGPLVYGLDAVQAGLLAASNPAALSQYVNQAMLAAEASQPEGQRIQLDITGWAGPFGASMAPQVADKLNAAFSAGQVKDPATGTPMAAWPESPGQVAWGDAVSDTVTIRWVKGQIMLIALAVFFALGILLGIYLWNRIHGSAWTGSAVGGSTAAGGWAGLPFLVKAGIIGGGILLGLGALWFYAELELRRAGASRENINISVPQGYGESTYKGRPYLPAGR